MTVGIYATKSDVDVHAGQLAQKLRDVLDDIGNFKMWLDSQTDPDLTTNYSYSTGDIATLRSSYVDLEKLHQIYLGLATQTPAYDFRTFAKLLA